MADNKISERYKLQGEFEKWNITEKNEAYKKLEDALYTVEGRLVACLWKEPNLFFETDLRYESFYYNGWATIFFVGWSLITDPKNIDKKAVLSDPQMIEDYLKQHKKTKRVWDALDADTYLSMQNASEVMTSENLFYFVERQNKIITFFKMHQAGLIEINDKTIKLCEDCPLDQVYQMYEAKLNDIFSNTGIDIKSYGICDGIDENIRKWDEGEAMGIPFDGLPHFSEMIGGIPDAGVSLIGGVSNVGKSTVIRNCILPVLFPTIEEIESKGYINKSVIFLNEEGMSKWQREIITWVINNIIEKKDVGKFNKSILRNGNFLKDSKVRSLIFQAKEWMLKNIPSESMRFLPLEKFSTQEVIKMIKKYSCLGYKTFIIDTFKMDNIDNSKVDSNNVRLQLIQNITHLYNIAKEEAKNVRVICTVQLAKASIFQRYLSQESLAESKNMVDPCSLGVFMRRVWDDELAGGAKQLMVYEYGKDANNSDPIPLSTDRNYIIFFPVKTREGEVGRQGVAEVDWGSNTLREIGWTSVSPLS